MNLKEILKNHGIDNVDLEKQINEVVQVTVTEKLKDSIPYSRFKEVVDERNSLKSNLAELESENENFKTKISEFDSLKSQYEEASQKLSTYKEAETKKEIEELTPYYTFLNAKEEDSHFETAKKLRELIPDLTENIQDLNENQRAKLKDVKLMIDATGLMKKENEITPTPKSNYQQQASVPNKIETPYDRLLALQKNIK